jgi:hypothetical protein
MFLKYIKSTRKKTSDSLLVHIADHFTCGLGEAEEFTYILRKEGVEHILSQRGIEEKEIKKTIKRVSYMTKNTDVWGVTLDNPPTQIPSLFNPSPQIPLTPTDTQKAVTDFENTYPTLAKAWKETQQEQYELFAKKNVRLWFRKYFIRY